MAKKTTSLCDLKRKIIDINCTMISIAIIEDIAEIRESLVEYFKSQPNFLCETAVEKVEDFLKISPMLYHYDIILLDIGLPGINGIDAIKLIKEKRHDTDIIMFTVYDDQNKIFQALCAGASGYILKSTPFPKIKAALDESYAGGAPMSPQIARKVLEFFHNTKQEKRQSPLTEKEKQIVAGLVNGLSYKMIASFQNNSIETVRFHIKNIYKKLHVNSKAEVITKSLKGEI